jgi:predicted small secreted protein
MRDSEPSKYTDRAERVKPLLVRHKASLTVSLSARLMRFCTKFGMARDLLYDIAKGCQRGDRTDFSKMENVMKALSAMLAVAMLMVFGLTIPGCNTTKGVGQDMQSGGQSIEKSADQHGAQP